jgi:hypothetical protein
LDKSIHRFPVEERAGAAASLAPSTRRAYSQTELDTNVVVVVVVVAVVVVVVVASDMWRARHT